MEWNELSNNFLVNEGMTANKECSFFQKKHYMILKHNYKNLYSYQKTPVCQSWTINCFIFNHTNLKLCKNSTKQTAFQGHIFYNCFCERLQRWSCSRANLFYIWGRSIKMTKEIQEGTSGQILALFFEKLSDEEREHIFSKTVQPPIQPVIQWTLHDTFGDQTISCT